MLWISSSSWIRVALFPIYVYEANVLSRISRLVYSTYFFLASKEARDVQTTDTEFTRQRRRRRWRCMVALGTPSALRFSFSSSSSFVSLPRELYLASSLPRERVPHHFLRGGMKPPRWAVTSSDGTSTYSEQLTNNS